MYKKEAIKNNLNLKKNELNNKKYLTRDNLMSMHSPINIYTYIF